MSLERSPEYRRAARAALRWTRAYTRGLDVAVADNRRDEIASDVHEHAVWAEEQGLSTRQLGRTLRWRLLRGIPADLSWAVAERSAANPAVRFVVRGAAAILAVALPIGLGTAVWAMTPASVELPGASAPIVDRELIKDIEAGLQRRADTFAATVECLEAAGWMVRVTGTESFEVPGQTEEQAPRVSEDYRTCSTQTGWMNSAPVATHAQLSQLYDYEVATLRCIRDFGVQVKAAPSREDFVDRQQSAPDFWTAYSAIKNGPGSVERRTGESLEWLHETCPAPIEYTSLL